MMKKYLFLLAGILGMFASCSDGAPTPEEPAAITIDSSIITNGLVFDAAGGEKLVSFSVNKEWMLSVAATTGGSNWCSASVTNGGEGNVIVKFIAKENTSYDDRSVSVTIKAEDVSKTFTITQKAVDALLLTSSKFEVSQKGGTIDVEVKANITYQLEVSEVAKSWITPTTTRALTARKHSFTIAASEELDKREGEIYVKSGNKIETVKIVQEQKDTIVLSKIEYEMPSEGGILDLEVNSNVDFAIEIAVDWIKQTAATKGLESKQYHFTIDENTAKAKRDGTITFIYKELKQVVNVTQLGVIPYVTFTADNRQLFQMSNAVENMEWSLNGSEWKLLGTTYIPFGGSEGTLRLRGKNGKGTAESNSYYSQILFVNDTPVACSGDIRTLVDYEDYENVDTSNAAFVNLFKDCSCLISAPELPATTLAESCYENMFRGCTSLIAAPELPATTLAKSCYELMFVGCTSLTSVPKLPATTLADYCYSNMFYGCTGLTAAPELPATSLATKCYHSMFGNCTSLTTAPKLPATTLAIGCYSLMFSDCTSLTSAPKLPATTLAASCYSLMFSGCISLTSAPELPATTLATSCYYDMFKDCSNLTAAPKLPATTLASNCYEGMFRRCTSLTNAPSELPATTLERCCYQYMFKECTSLTTTPVLPASTLVDQCYFHMFDDCENLTTVTMLAIDMKALNCLGGWLKDVSSTGTFYKSRTLSKEVAEEIVPFGWTIENYRK